MPDGQPWPKISIVTPSYNQGEFIEETIRSVLLQGYPNLEYIIIDGGSTDDSVEVIKKYEPWIAHWVSEPDDGQAHAINKGFKAASGEVFGYLNSDDVYLPGSFERVAAIHGTMNGDKQLYTFSGAEWDGNKVTSKHMPRSRPDLRVWLENPSSLFQPATFWTSKLHEAVGGFDESLDFCFDKDFFIQAIFKHRCYRPDPEFVAARFRLHPDSKTSTMAELCQRENQLLLDRYKHHEVIGPVYQRCVRHHTASQYVASSYRQDDWVGRAGALAKAASSDPRIVLSRYFLGAVRNLF